MYPTRYIASDFSLVPGYISSNTPNHLEQTAVSEIMLPSDPDSDHNFFTSVRKFICNYVSIKAFTSLQERSLIAFNNFIISS